MTYCTILSNRGGSPHRFYGTPQQALKAAQRHCKRHGAAMEVAGR